ncbi:substance-P receptor-like [Hydractinia symbiolongicarpus]|uniref:substance-P receptor-like n=1 Tax=Hydractinia symbiolongicarpus TaxID=13093 RepID=UPI00254A22B4|nr:substance-P receptor-like [Hydractinia symbiolongicarpus]
MDSEELKRFCLNNTATFCQDATDFGKDLPIYFFVSVIVVTLVGLTLNTTVIYCTIRKKKQKSAMDILLLSLAVSDAIFNIITAIALLLSMVGAKFGYFDVFVISAVTFEFTHLSVIASTLHVLMISFERYLAVLHPLRYKSYTGTRRMKKIIFILWILTLLIQSSKTIFQFHDGFVSSIKYEQEVFYISAGIIFTSGIILGYVYSFVGFALYKHIISQESMRVQFQSKRLRKETTATITGGMVTSGFIILTYPLAVSFCMPYDSTTAKVTIAL